MVVAAAWTGAGHSSTCTFAQKSQRELVRDAYMKKMPAARAAYFKTHTSKAARAAFVAKQNKTLATLKSAASCDDSVALPGPVAAPAPTANEHFIFGDEMTTADRQQITDDVAYAAQDEQALLGMQLDEVNVFATKVPSWLAQKECDFSGNSNDQCYTQLTNGYAAGDSAHGGYRYLTLNWGANGWSQTSQTQKIIAHEIFHTFQYQMDGIISDGSVPFDQVRKAGPVWLLEGAAEMVGYRVLGDRHLEFATYSASLANEKFKAKPVTNPLDQLQTVNQSNTAGAPYALYMVAADHLVSLAPDGIKSLVTYYRSLGSGTAWPDAFQQAFGMTVDAYYANFATYKSHL
jgi:hypothetical protein